MKCLEQTLMVLHLRDEPVLTGLSQQARVNTLSPRPVCPCLATDKHYTVYSRHYWLLNHLIDELRSVRASVAPTRRLRDLRGHL